MDTINKDGKEVTRRTILVSQNGVYAKSYFTKDDNKGLPKWNMVKVGNKTVTDKTEYLEFLENFVLTNLVPALITNEDHNRKAVAKPTEPSYNSQPSYTTEPDNTEEDNKLPWE